MTNDLKKHSLLSFDGIKNHNIGRYASLLLLSILYFALAKFGMSFISLKPSNITLLWLPSGLAFAMCVHYGRSAWFWIFLASFAANFSGMMAMSSLSNAIHTCLSAAIDTFAGIFAAFMYRKFLPQGINQVTEFLPFVGLVAFSTGLLSSLLLSANLSLGGYLKSAEVMQFVTMITLADTLGILVLAPIYLKANLIHTLSFKEQNYFVIGILVTTLFAYLFYLDTVEGVVYLFLPVLLLLSFYINILMLSILSALTLIIIVLITANGHGHFVSTSSVESYQQMMMFLVATSLTTLGIGVQNQQLILNQNLATSFKNAANTDEMTGLLNRRSFFPYARSLFFSVKQQKNYPALSIAALDLDFFKKINDSFGHAAGDAVLLRFSKLLSEITRKGDLAARIGGEEFIILMKDCNIEDAITKMERLRTQLETSVTVFSEKDIAATVSIGVTRFITTDQSVDDMLKRADKALYRAKYDGRNRVVSIVND